MDQKALLLDGKKSDIMTTDDKAPAEKSKAAGQIIGKSKELPAYDGVGPSSAKKGTAALNKTDNALDWRTDPLAYGAKSLPPYSGRSSAGPSAPHSNPLIEAGKLRARDEQEMQNWLQQLQYKYRIYNSDIEPEHETDYPCDCPVHKYQRAKWARFRVQDQWNSAVIYPGEKAYNGNNPFSPSLFSGNPYSIRVVSPYSSFAMNGMVKTPNSRYHAMAVTQTIALNKSLNQKAQTAIDDKEPTVDIWGDHSWTVPATGDSKATTMSKFRNSIGIKSSAERQLTKAAKNVDKSRKLRDAIVEEERGRWRDDQWVAIVHMYQEKTGMAKKIAELRARQPIQYLHLLRAGYFEPIPVAWADQNSNPLKFSIEAAEGWRGITPAWRGFEDTAEERLYWVLNHREGVSGTRMKPDFISELDMARERMGRAVEPPPQYYDVNDVCHVQHRTDGYSKQVLPPPFRPFDQPETANDDTMILLDVSGSMDFTPQSPVYDRYLITGFRESPQPKNKDLAKAIIRRFSDAMMNHDHAFSGYDLTTFSNHAKYVGTVNHQNLDQLWKTIKIGGGTRVMTGWQKVKELHFTKHSESAIHHPVYGWQAGPDTPILRLLLLLDGEATDMDEFELDLLGLSWAHVTIFLIGVDGCPHHHRHANELQRISDVNHHVSFVDAQGNTPERFVTHELLKRHLGYDVSMEEFTRLETPPTYDQATGSVQE
ncbi:hypothetical protein BCR39DRAFT_288552 [Naematelia encephala]|uniref:VWFA domain-containing protein n=1 Tax=Naematelia encephala TaxID=71784 RepID=A0A1Y2ASE7_9TREE|nr:hypothetical protein BCR39DRAFT_288552 [Naematelia encephala]